MNALPSWLLDASVVIKVLVGEEDSPKALALMRHDLAAPDLLLAECANALWRKHRLGLLDAVEATRRVERLSRLPVRLLPARDFLTGALTLAIRLDQPVYDCIYIEAAAVTGLTLVTADRRLAGLAGGLAAVTLLSDLPSA